MKKDFFKKLVFFILSSCIFVSGCSFSGDDDNMALKAAILLSMNNNAAGSDKVRVNLKFETPRGGTILASQELKDLVFSGIHEGGETYSTTAPDKTSLCNKAIWLQTGNWTFNIEGKIDNVIFKDTKTVEISPANTTVEFTLKPYNGDEAISNGGLSLVLNFCGDADYAKLKVTNTATGTIAAEKSFSSFEPVSVSEKKWKFDYSKSFKEQDSEGFEPGTYLITVEFYCNNMKSGDQPLNIWEAYARIKPGLTAAAEITDYDLTESYTITYNDIDGAELADSGVVVRCYSRKSNTITLPIYKKTVNGKEVKVLCWYETENFDISEKGIMEFNSSKLKHMNFYPLWDTDTAHVANGGTGNGLTAANPASSVTAALSTLQKLHAYGSAQTDLTVQVSGEVTGNTTIDTSLDSFADSLTLCGKDGNETDILYGAGSGSVITVQSTKPVTVKNLQIKGGRGVSNGGGIYIGGTSSVILEDGALININTATKTGGGIYVSKNTGTAGRTSLTINAGAKITKNEVSSNNSEYGGMGIFAESAKIVMNGGEISQNNGKSSDQRGAIRLHGGCVFELNDGKITNNSAYHIAGNIFCRASTINMKGGEISSGKASTKNGGGGGGGLWIEGASSFNMTGGVFLNNTAEKGSGGAVYIDGRNSEGVGPVFSMSGTAYIPSATKQSRDNDIYYQKNSDGKTYPAIEISGALTPKTEDVQKGKIALSPKLWERKQIVLKKAATAPSELDISVFKPYFAFTDAGSTLSFALDKATLTAPYYVASNGTNEDDTPGTETSPFKTLEYALGRLTDGVEETIRIKGTLKGSHIIPASFDTTKCSSITIIGASNLDSEGNMKNVDQEPVDVLTLADDAESGSVLTINSQVPVTLKNIKITGGKGRVVTDDNTSGGGIYFNKGSLTLADGVRITGNTATISGGGIYVDSSQASLYMYGNSYIGDTTETIAQPWTGEDSSKSANYSVGAGGGIYNNGKVYLGYKRGSDGSPVATEWKGGICRNNANNGGAICTTSSAVLKMNSGKIAYNSAKKEGSSSCEGGGIYIGSTSESTVVLTEFTGGEINSNDADNGGGIFVENLAFTLTGVKMTGNTATSCGGAIYNNGSSFNLSGSVYIPCAGEKQNDVYLAEDKFITIAGNLILPTDAPDNAKNVKITPSAWNRGAQVLGAATAALIADNKGHFATIDEDFTVDQKSGETTKGVLSAPIYVATYLTDDTRYGNVGYTMYEGARGTRAKPYSSLETALKAADASSHIIYIDGTFTGKTEISSTTLPNTDMLTLRGYIPEGQTVAKATLNGNFSSFANNNTTLIINDAKKVDIYDLTIKGGNNKSSNYGASATPGGGILITGSADVTLNSGTIITDNTACYGGGVSVFKGKLTVNNGAVVRKNTAKKDSSSGGYGGGIYVGKNGFLSLAGGMIGDSTLTANGNNAMRGGGIYADYNDEAPDEMRLEMTGGSVSHNLREVDGTYQEAGAGLYICGKARISGGVIDHNTTAGNAPKGGGIYLDLHSVCTISGDVEISNNEAYYGAGIYSYTYDLTVEGGIFRNNNANTSGGAIYAYRNLKLKGNPVFWKAGDVIEENQNDISLSSYKSIEITGPVTSTATYIAAVSPTYKRGEYLLSSSAENISNMDAALSKFVLTKDNDGWNREKINANKIYIINSPIYVVGTGHNSFFQDPPASGATGTKNMPYASIFAAEEAMDDNSMDYEVIVDGSVSGPQKFSYTDNTSLRAKSVSIKGYKPNASYTVTATLNGSSSGSALTIDAKTADFPVTIQDLTITGGSADNGGGINITKGTVKLAGGAKITGNTATSNGGGVYVSANGTLFMYGKALVGDNAKSTTTATSTSTSTYANKAAKGAGIYNNGGSVYLGYSAADSITDLTSNNTDGYYGVSRNYATDSGGGIYHAYGTLLIASGNISYNRGDSKAGAVYFNYYSSSNTETTLAAGTFKGNTSPMGGAFYIAGSKTVTISGPVDISSNTAVAPTNGGTSYAGAVYNAGTLKITGNATIKGNSASAVGVSGGSAGGANGGAIYNSGTLTITGSSAKISGNSAKVTVNGSAYGGGIHNTGNFILEAGSIGESSSLNYVSGPETKGGAVFQYNTFIMKSSGTVFAGTGTGLNQNDVYLAKKSTDATKVYCISVSDGALNSSSTAKITSELLDNGLTVIDGTNLATGNTGFTMADSGSGFNIVHSGTLGKLDIGATIYVSESAISGVTGGVAGDDTSGYGTQKRPFATIQKAAQKTWREQAYTISVNGTLTATGSGTDEGKGNLQNIPNSTDIKATSITLTGTNSATINANSKGSAFTLSKAIPVTITNLKITGGSATNGGGILVNGVAGAKLTLGDGVTITANNATGGAGIYFEGTSSSKGNLILKGSSGKISSISANTASNSGGGVYLKYANLCMSGYSVIGDTTASKATSGSKSNSAKYGGGVYCDTDATVWLGYSEANTSKSATLQSTYGICRNYASDSTYSGGGIYFSAAGTHYMSGGSVDYNGAAAAGGGVYLSTGTLNIAGGTISNNAATSGGGLYIGNSNSAIAKLYGSSVIDGNTATNGGGVYVDGAAGSGGSATRGKLLVYGNGLIGKTGNTIASTSTYGNRATNGGGIYNKGTVCIGYSAWTSSSSNTPVSCSGGVRRNYAGSTGGGICSEEDYIYLHAGDIAYNCSNANGGGIALKDGTTSYWAYVDMDGGTISYNQCESTDGTKGAGIYAQHGSITVTGGTINNNTKAAKGGGVYLDTESRLYMKNASGKTTSGEIKSNTATYGGAVYMDQCDTASGINLYGAASIPKGSDEKNDIYVNATSSDKPKISISEVLTNSSISLVTGSSYFYVEGYSIVKGYDSNCTSCSSKLEIKSQSSQDWTITTASLAGTLAKAKKMTSSNISSFSPSSGTNYNFVIDSTVSASDMKTFLEKLCNEEVNTSKTKIGSSSVLDLSKSNLTSIANMTFGNSSDEKLVEQTFAKVILPSTNCASMLANWRVRKCLSGAKSFEVAPGSTTMCTDNNGVVYNADKTKIIYYPAARAGSSYSWPTTVTEVGAFAFALTKNLTTMNIPNTVKTIGSDAFNSSSITSLSVPSSVTSMGDEVFVSCTKLVTASIDAPTVEHLAFGYCTSLTSITFGTSVKTIKQETINGCSALTTLTFSTTSGWKKDDGTSVNVSNFTQAKTALSTYVSGASCSLKR